MFDLCPNKCKNGKNECVPHTVPPYVISASFILGLLSATAFRILIVFQHVAPHWVRPTWYIGIIGYTFFFMYRYLIACRRKTTIDNYNLIEKIATDAPLNSAERNATIYLLQSIKKSRENLNYLWIFITSIIAVLCDVILSLKGL